MKNLKIGLLLHFYQPWWQFSDTLKNIVNQCYRPILKIINEVDGFCFSANINLSLLDLLKKDFPDIIHGFREAVDAGKIELTGSPAQHPILPLIPEFLKRAQIEDDESRKEHQFGIKRNCSGFYLPEMAFSKNDVRLLRDYRYKWTVIDDKLFGARNKVPFDQVITYNGFKIFMRSRLWSNIISFDHPNFNDFRSRLEYSIPNWTKGAQAYLIIAMDVETFGHHPGTEHLPDQLLRPMLREWVGKKIMPLETIGQNFSPRSVPDLSDSSWSTEVDDLNRGDPYPLWNSRLNIFHLMLWDLVNMALKYFDHYRQDCLMMTSSCHWWWISGRPYWEPEFMKLGAKKAIDIIRCHLSSKEINGAEKLYKKLEGLN